MANPFLIGLIAALTVGAAHFVSFRAWSDEWSFDPDVAEDDRATAKMMLATSFVAFVVGFAAAGGDLQMILGML